MQLIEKRELDFVSLVETKFTQPKEMRRRSHWLVHLDDEASLQKLKDNNLLPLLARDEDEEGNLLFSLLGYPVKFAEVRPGDIWFGTDGDYVVLRVSQGRKES